VHSVLAKKNRVEFLVTLCAKTGAIKIVKDASPLFFKPIPPLKSFSGLFGRRETVFNHIMSKS